MDVAFDTIVKVTVNPLNCVTVLVQVAKQVHASVEAARGNEEEIKHLLGRLQVNTHLISGVLHEGITSSANDIRKGLKLALERVIARLHRVRDIVFKHLLTNSGLFGRFGNVSAASRLREDLKDEDRRLSDDLNDLKGLIGAETWHLLKKLGQDAQQEEAAPGLRLPEDVLEQLRALQSVAEVQQAVDKKMLNRIAKLVAGSEREKVSAAAKLARLAGGSPQDRAVLEGAGLVPVMVELLHSENRALQLHAVITLCHLAEGSVSSRPVIVGVGGVPALTQLLCSDDTQLEAHSAAALHALVFTSPADPLARTASDGIKAVVTLSSKASDSLQLAAAAAMCKLATAGTAAYIAAMTTAGGVPALVQLLNRGNRAAQEYAAAAVCALACSLPCRPKLTEAGAIPMLVQLLSSSSSKAVQQYAAAATASLADNSPRVKKAAAEAGAIQPLVRLLRSDSEGVQYSAAVALAKVAAGDSFNKEAIAQAGAIPALAALQQNSDVKEEVREQAAATLDVLAQNNRHNEMLIAEAFGRSVEQ